MDSADIVPMSWHKKYIEIRAWLANTADHPAREERLHQALEYAYMAGRESVMSDLISQLGLTGGVLRQQELIDDFNERPKQKEDLNDDLPGN